MAGGAEICKIVIAIFLPPLAVLLERGCGADLLINILLTLLCHLPGVIHAIYLILHDRERRRDSRGSNAKLLYPPQQQQQYNDQAMYGKGPGYHYGGVSKDAPPAQPTYREVPVSHGNDEIHAMPPTYGDYTERDIAGTGTAPVHTGEKHEYAPVTATPAVPQNYYSTKEI